MRIPLAQEVKERDGRARLPHRDGMDPDERLRGVGVNGGKSKPEARFEALFVFTLHETLPYDFGQDAQGIEAKRTVINHYEPIPLNEKAAFCDFFAPFLVPFLAYKTQVCPTKGTKNGTKNSSKISIFHLVE